MNHQSAHNSGQVENNHRLFEQAPGVHEVQQFQEAQERQLNAFPAISDLRDPAGPVGTLGPIGAVAGHRGPVGPPGPTAKMILRERARALRQAAAYLDTLAGMTPEEMTSEQEAALMFIAQNMQLAV